MSLLYLGRVRARELIFTPKKEKLIRRGMASLKFERQILFHLKFCMFVYTWPRPLMKLIEKPKKKKKVRIKKFGDSSAEFGPQEAFCYIFSMILIIVLPFLEKSWVVKVEDCPKRKKNRSDILLFSRCPPSIIIVFLLFLLLSTIEEDKSHYTGKGSKTAEPCPVETEEGFDIYIELFFKKKKAFEK